MNPSSKSTWSDISVSPISGCQGCELYPTAKRLVDNVDDLLACYSTLIPGELRRIMLNTSPGELLRYRADWIQQILDSADTHTDIEELRRRLEVCVRASVRCWAASFPEASADTSPDFDQIRVHTGATSAAAKLPPLQGMDRPDRPWLNGLPRIISISYDGDALSPRVDFDTLLREVIEVCHSEAGHQHLWVLSTKRPSRMVELAGWLTNRGIPWPDNLVAATSITSESTLRRLDILKQVPAKLRMVAFEPLWGPVAPDLAGISWTVVGGEVGPYARPFELSWLDDIRSACVQGGSELFVTQLGSKPQLHGTPLMLTDPTGAEWTEWPERYRLRQLHPSAQAPMGVTMTNA